MKASDLMVGDWVICNHYQDKSFTKQFGIADFAKGEYEFCEPIPLSEEILVKNEFRIQVTHDNGRWLWVTDNSWLAYSECHNYWYYEDMKITYVHQLQHLLRLVGIEKELTID